MENYLSTIVLRHRKENLKKCSLRNLEQRKDFIFYRYPLLELPSLNEYVMLTLDAPILSERDQDKGLLIIDGTWRYAEKMCRFVEQKEPKIIKRSLPQYFKTAYPRSQEDCSDPQRGLASLEAVFIAYWILKRETKGLLDHYHWKELFLAANSSHFQIS